MIRQAQAGRVGLALMGLLLAGVSSLVACAQEGLPPVDATRPSRDARILKAPATMSDGSPIPEHVTETVSTSIDLVSHGLIGGISVDADGNIYNANMTDSVWRTAPDGTTVLLNGEFTRASGNLPLADGDLLQADWNENRVYRIKPDGSRAIFAEGGLEGPVGIVQRPNGDFIVANSRGEFLARIPPEGGPAEVALTHPDMTQPNGVAIDSEGNIYISDLDSGRVFKWTARGDVVIVAVLPGRGNAHAAIAGGGLYVNKIWDHVIYRVDLETGAYGIVTGNGRAGYEDGPTGVATIEEPNGIAANPTQDVVYFNTQRGAMGLDVADGLVIVRRLVLPQRPDVH